MAEIPESFDQMFPKLDDAQMARLAAFGEQRQARPGEILFEQGDAHHSVFVVLEGSIELVGISSAGETVVGVLGSGMFTGEVSQLSGRRSLGCLAREASALLKIGRANLRRIMRTDAALGEIFLREFLTRNGHPQTYLDVERDPDIRVAIKRRLLGPQGLA